MSEIVQLTTVCIKKKKKQKTINIKECELVSLLNKTAYIIYINYKFVRLYIKNKIKTIYT